MRVTSHFKVVARILAGCSILVLSACSASSSSDSTLQRFAKGFYSTLGLSPDESLGSPDAIAVASQSLSREQEYYLGRAVAARILSIYQPSQDEVLNTYLNTVGQAVASFSSQPETFGGYHVQLLESTEVNAMAAPGGFIFITTGLLKSLPSEDALAGVLAHEVGHVVNQDATRSISPSHLAKVLGTLGVVAGSLNCNQVLQQASLVLAASVDDVVDTLLKAGYSREQEFAADAGSVTILRKAHYTPEQLVEALRSLEVRSVNRDAGWFATHPSNAERIAALDALLEEPQVYAASFGKREQRFRAMQARIP